MSKNGISRGVLALGQFAYPAIYTVMLATGEAGLLQHSIAAVVMWVFVAFNVASGGRVRTLSPETDQSRES